MTQGVRTRIDPQEPLMAVIERLDPEVILVGLLGGIAAGGGIVPPFTRMLSAFGGMSSDVTDLYNRMGPSALALGVSPPAALLALLTNKNEDGSSGPPERYALMASGALEAMVMMSLVKNPGFLEAMGNLAGKAIDKIPGR